MPNDDMSEAASPGNKHYVHEKGICESVNVGPGTRIWAFAHVLPGAQIGENCNICDQVFIENDVIVGDEVTVKCGVQLWDGVRIGNRVFIGPNATFTNDRMPRSKHYPEKFAQTVLEDNCSIGANATILPGVRIGRNAMVGAGAVVTRDVPPYATVVGNPAKIIGYQSDTATAGKSVRMFANTTDLAPNIGARLDIGIGKAFLERLPHFDDMRGSLTALEGGRGLPFSPARVFLVYDVASSRVRGEHAHHQCEQFLIAAHGALSVVLDNGFDRAEVRLEDQTVGLYLPPMIWGVQYKFEADTVLIVMASHPYDASDYIRNYETFRQLVNSKER